MSTSHTYTNAEGSFHIPQIITNNNGINGYSAAWVGLGSGNASSTPLVQAGSDSYDYGPGDARYYLWWEVYPQISERHIGISVYPGDNVTIYVSESTSAGTMRVIDTNASLDVTYRYTGSWNSSQQAEWIYERPAINGGLPQLADAPPTFTGAEAKYSGTYYPLGSLSHYFNNMEDCHDTLMAYPGAISANGLSFPEYFRNHGAGNDC